MRICTWWSTSDRKLSIRGRSKRLLTKMTLPMMRQMWLS